MHVPQQRSVLAVLGFSAFGASLASTLIGSAQSALLTPLAAALALASLLPLLYVVATLFSLAPPLRETLHIAGASYQDVGIALLGLSPAAAFLRPVAPWLVVGPGVLLALRIATLAFARRHVAALDDKASFQIHLGVGAWMCLVGAMTVSFLDKWS